MWSGVDCWYQHIPSREVFRLKYFCYAILTNLLFAKYEQGFIDELLDTLQVNKICQAY